MALKTTPGHSRYRNTRFLTSAVSLSKCPLDVGAEIVFAGRSNAGKSSLINTLCDQVKLVKVAKTPGRTRMLNFFQIDKHRRLLDLPGYGYARVPKAVQAQWEELLPVYFAQRQSLRGVVLVVDIRRQLTQHDEHFLRWYHHLPIHIVLTKADQLKRTAQQTVYADLKKTLNAQTSKIGLQLFSSKTRQGVEALRVQLDAWFV